MGKKPCLFTNPIPVELAVSKTLCYALLEKLMTIKQGFHFPEDVEAGIKWSKFYFTRIYVFKVPKKINRKGIWSEVRKTRANSLSEGLKRSG